MKQSIAATLLSFLLIAPVAAAADESNGHDAVRILVTIIDPGITRTARIGPPGPSYRRRSTNYVASPGVRRQARKLAREFSLKLLDEWPIVALDVHCIVFELDIGSSADELLSLLDAREDIDSAQLLNEFEVSASNATMHDDPFAHLQHTLETLELRQAHSWSVGEGTEITIIDTGADLDHPDLASQIRTHRDFVPDTKHAFSNDAHGTAVAGIISASSGNGIGTVGIAPEARLTILRACWYRSGKIRAVCNSFTLAQALSFAIDQKTNIINLSLGGPPDNLLERLIAVALQRGIVVIAAAPNDSGAKTLGFPATIPGVITVRSFEQSRPVSVDHPVVLGAPGKDILVLAPRDNYDYVTGSSMAAAHVSGIVSLLLSKRPDLTGGEIRTLLVHSQRSTANSVNACRALSQLLQEPGCRNDEKLSATF